MNKDPTVDPAKDQTAAQTTKELISNPSNVAISTAFSNFKTIEDMKVAAKELLDSKMLNFKNVSEVMLAMQGTIDLGLPLTFGLTNLYPIQGKLSAGVHVLEALVLRGGCIITIEESYEPVVHLKIKGGFTKIMSLREYENQSTYIILTTEEFNSG